MVILRHEKVNWTAMVQDILYERKEGALDFLKEYANLAKNHKWTLRVWNGNAQQEVGKINTSDLSLKTHDGKIFKLEKGKAVVIEKGKKRVIKKEKNK